jgi:hypothetical protein
MFWEVYYGDGSTFGVLPERLEDYYEDSSPEDAPARNVQVILQEDPDIGWVTLSSSDYYIWKGDRWVGVDFTGLILYLIDPGWKKVLVGETITHKEFKEIFKGAREKWGEKQGFKRGERKP